MTVLTLIKPKHIVSSFLSAMLVFSPIAALSNECKGTPTEPVVSKASNTFSIRAADAGHRVFRVVDCTTGAVLITNGEGIFGIDATTQEKRAEYLRQECRSNGLVPHF